MRLSAGVRLLSCSVCTEHQAQILLSRNSRIPSVRFGSFSCSLSLPSHPAVPLVPSHGGKHACFQLPRISLKWRARRSIYWLCAAAVCMVAAQDTCLGRSAKQVTAEFVSQTALGFFSLIPATHKSQHRLICWKDHSDFSPKLAMGN